MSNTEASRAKRLDQHVVDQFPEISRAFAVKLIAEGRVLINGIASKPGYKPRADDQITIDYEASEYAQIPHIDLPILYEDKDVVVIDKPAGLLTHSKGAFNPEATVATWLRSRLSGGLSGERGGIVHRLDRGTSGVLICAKNPQTLAYLQKQFSTRNVKKTYIAIVAGHMPHDRARIDMPIMRNPKRPQTFRADAGGKSALTEYEVREEAGARSLLALRPTTGRTHQLRVHLSEVGHPIIGDTLYGGEPADRLYLHAHQLELTLPSRKRQVFTSVLPDAFHVMMKA